MVLPAYDLPMATLARAQGFQRIFVPEAGAAEAALVPGLEVIPASSLGVLYAHLSRQELIPPRSPGKPEELPIQTLTDFREVKDQELVKRLLEVAASGGHNA